MSDRDKTAMASDPERMICAYFDGEITDQQFAQLKAWLLSDSENCRRFAHWATLHNGLYGTLRQVELAEFLNTDEPLGGLEPDELELDIDPKNVHAMLQEAAEVDQRLAREAARARARQQAAKDAAERRRQEELDRLNRPRGSSFIEVPLTAVYLAALAASVLLILGVQAMWNWQEESQQRLATPNVPTENAVAATPTIATIAKSMQARWSDPALSAVSDTRLEAGPLVLDDGVVEIAFDEGASMVVEAPAALELLSASRVRVVRGRVVAQVPEEAIGFTVVSEAAAIVDLGTEFGVVIDDAGNLGVHVIEGEVALAPKGQEVTGRRATLLEGTARRIAGDGATVAEVEFDRTAFLREVPASPYELAVLRDRPTAFWRMNEPAGSSEVASQGRVESLASVPRGVELAATVNRPEPGNSAASFAGEHSGINLGHLPELALQHSFTLEAWIRTPKSLEMKAPHRLISTFQSAPQAGFAFGLASRNWTARNDLPSLVPIFTFYGVYDCVAVHGLRPNGLAHLAVVVDAEGRPAVYVNGKSVPLLFRAESNLFDEFPEQWDAGWTGAASSGPCYLGRNPPDASGQYPPERFQSLIDELVVFDKALAPEDISAHYEAGLSRGDPNG